MIFLTHTTYKATIEENRHAHDVLEKFLARKDIGFPLIVDRDSLWSTSQRRAEEIRKSFRNLVVMGIGGSAMGGKAIFEIFDKPSLNYKVHFIDNIDGHYFWHQLEKISSPEKAHFVLVSKSGNTTETLAMANFAHQWLKAKKLDLAKQCTVISEVKENILTRWATKYKVPVLEIPIDVGGRFSVLTPVGLLPAAFMGLDLEEMRQGARWGVQDREIAAQLIAQSIASFKRQEWITCFWAYCDVLQSFGLWFQQLWSESLAKKLDRENKLAPRTSTPLSLIGSRDQHSVLQQIAEGARDKFIWFLRVSESEDFGPVLENDIFMSGLGFETKNLGRIFSAQATATSQGLEQLGINSLSLRIGHLREKELAALFMLMQVVVGGLGEHLNINAFDQPGVELGKRLARQILQN